MFRESVRAALEAISEIPKDDPLRPIAFQEVLRASLGDTRGEAVEVREPQPDGSPDNQSQNRDRSGADPVSRLAARLGVAHELLNQIFDFGGEPPTLILASGRLAPARATATQQIALLMCAATQGGVGQTETSSDLIRRACVEFGRYDEGNFAASLRQIGQLLIPGGTPRARTYRLTRPGFDRVRSLIETMAVPR